MPVSHNSGNTPPPDREASCDRDNGCGSRYPGASKTRRSRFVIPHVIDRGRPNWPHMGRSHAQAIRRIWGCGRSEEHTSELQSLMRISYAVFCLKKKKRKQTTNKNEQQKRIVIKTT